MSLRRALLVVLLIVVAVLAAVLLGCSGPGVAGGGRGAPRPGSPFPPGIVRASRESPCSVDYGLLRTAGQETLYSSALPWMVCDVDAAFRAELKAEPATITDATAHIGADTANFLKLYPRAHVTSLELSPATCAVLRQNGARVQGALGRPGTFRAVNAEAGAWLGAAPTADLVYIDPPWGGPGHYEPLPLGGVPFSTLVRRLLDRGGEATGGARAVVAKLPRVYDLDAFVARVGRPASRHAIHDSRREGKISYWLLFFHN